MQSGAQEKGFASDGHRNSSSINRLEARAHECKFLQVVGSDGGALWTFSITSMFPVSAMTIQPGSLPTFVTDLAFRCPMTAVREHHKEPRQLFNMITMNFSC